MGGDGAWRHTEGSSSEFIMQPAFLSEWFCMCKHSSCTLGHHSQAAFQPQMLAAPPKSSLSFAR